MAHPAWRAAHCREHALHRHRAARTVGHVDDHIAGARVRVGRYIGDVVDRPDRHLLVAQLGDDFVERVGCHPLADQAVERVYVVEPGPVAGEAGILDQLDAADRGEQPRRRRVCRAGDRDPAVVAGAVDIARRRGRRAVAGARRRRAGQLVDPDVGAKHGVQALPDADIDHLADTAAGDVAVIDREHHGGGGVHAGEAVGQRELRQHRRPIGFAGHFGKAAHRLDQRAEPGLAAVGPMLAEAGHPGDDQARVRRRQRIGRDAPLLKPAGPEILDENVGIGEQAEQHVAPGRPRDIQRHQFLVARVVRPPRIDTVDGEAELAQMIAGPGMLHVDHLGAEIGHQPAAQRRGKDGSAFDDLEAGERLGRVNVGGRHGELLRLPEG